MENNEKVIIESENNEEVLKPVFLMDLQLFSPDEEDDSDDTGSEESEEDDSNEEEAEEESDETEESDEDDSNEEEAGEESEEAEESDEDDSNEEEAEEESDGTEESDDDGSEDEEPDEEEPEDDGEELDYDLGDDDDAFSSAADYELEDEWLEEDNGDWSEEDYEEFGGKVFADNEHFGESFDDWMAEEGNEPVEEAAASSYYEKLTAESPSASFDTIKFYKNGDMVIPQGFLTPEAFALLLAIFGAKFKTENLHLVDPPRNEELPKPKPQDLPEELRNVDPKDIVDLRKYCSPIGDQKQTGRCKAYAMTHGFEMLRIMANKKHEELSTNYTMLRTHKLLGKFTSYEKAHTAADGTPGTIEPLKNLIKYGICSAKLWPNDDKKPKVSEQEMDADAANYKIKLNPVNVGIEDVKKMLTKGIPVEFYMNTGTEFQKIGRDGILRQAEKPSGKHGCHSMLIVGYIGNYYIVKNSWGTSWGDKGYCYITKKALVESSPFFAALVPASTGKG
jgi:hypothetical protein